MFGGGPGGNGQGVNLTADQRAQRLVDELVPLQRAQPVEGGRYHQGSEMRAVVAPDVDLYVIDALFDQTGDFSGVHHRMAVTREAA